LPRSFIYTLYYNTTFSFQSDKLWSFHGLLLHGDHQQIHMKWMINYNKIPSNIFCCFKWWQDMEWLEWILPRNKWPMLSITCITFVFIMALAKVECKLWVPNPHQIMSFVLFVNKI
jgi:hypothetical protein